jgi:hypothetical protein
MATKKVTPAEKAKRLVEKHGLPGVNKPKMTPSHPTKKAVVVAKDGDDVALIRFGDQKSGHNYSPEAREGFDARHAKNIAQGKMSPAYWSKKVFWQEGGAKKNPPKSQKHVRGEVKGRRSKG